MVKKKSNSEAEGKRLCLRLHWNHGGDMGDSGEHADWGMLAIYPELLIRTGVMAGPTFLQLT